MNNSTVLCAEDRLPDFPNVGSCNICGNILLCFVFMSHVWLYCLAQAVGCICIQPDYMTELRQI